MYSLEPRELRVVSLMVGIQLLTLPDFLFITVYNPNDDTSRNKYKKMINEYIISRQCLVDSSVKQHGPNLALDEQMCMSVLYWHWYMHV